MSNICRDPGMLLGELGISIMVELPKGQYISIGLESTLQRELSKVDLLPDIAIVQLTCDSATVFRLSNM